VFVCVGRVCLCFVGCLCVCVVCVSVYVCMCVRVCVRGLSSMRWPCVFVFCWMCLCVCVVCVSAYVCMCVRVCVRGHSPLPRRHAMPAPSPLPGHTVLVMVHGTSNRRPRSVTVVMGLDPNGYVEYSTLLGGSNKPPGFIRRSSLLMVILPVNRKRGFK